MNPHGHNYVLEVTVAQHPARASGGLSNGMVIDVADLAINLNPVVARLDHKSINDAEISGPHSDRLRAQPTVENLALWFWESLAFLSNDGRMNLTRVRVYETDHLWADVTA